MQQVASRALATERTEASLAWLARVGQRRDTQVAVFAALVVWAALSGRWGHSDLAEPVAFGCAMLGVAPLLTLRWFPTVSLTLSLTANSVFILVGRLAWPTADVVAWLVALVACPIVLGRRRALLALLANELVVLAAAVIVSPHVSTTPWDATVAESLAALLAWTLGLILRQHQEAAAEQAAVAERFRALRDADAVSRGRVGIARELHDVVAHHVSLIAVRAATARYSLPDLAPPAARAFDEIAEQARTALAELRTVLGVLRAPQNEPDQAPQPRLADLSDLIEQVRAAGGRVNVAVTGSQSAPKSAPESVPESVQLCGYRIVQEALTNARRHAPNAAVTVELEYRPNALSIQVRDDGGATTATRATEESGYGLIGMRERVAMLGGTLQTGPAGRGFVVSAVLPFEPIR